MMFFVFQITMKFIWLCVLLMGDDVIINVEYVFIEGCYRQKKSRLHWHTVGKVIKNFLMHKQKANNKHDNGTIKIKNKVLAFLF